MPGADSTAYTARFLLPDLLERGRPNALSAPIYLDGALVECASGTISIFDGSNVARVSAQAVTPDADGIATYSYTPDLGLTLGLGWRVEWDLILQGGDKAYPRNEAALVRHRLYPVVTDADLYRRAGGLQSTAGDAISTLTTYQPYRDEAWAVIQGRLLGRGNRPNLIMSPSALREPHVCLSLALIFADFSSRNSAEYRETAADYREQYRAAWDALTFAYDEDDDGQADGSKRRSGHPVIFTCGRA